MVGLYLSLCQGDCTTVRHQPGEKPISHFAIGYNKVVRSHVRKQHFAKARVKYGAIMVSKKELTTELDLNGRIRGASLE